MLSMGTFNQSINQSITGSISIRDFGDHGLPLIMILCLSSCSNIVSDVAEPGVPWSSSSPLAVNCALGTLWSQIKCVVEIKYGGTLLAKVCGLLNALVITAPTKESEAQ